MILYCILLHEGMCNEYEFSNTRSISLMRVVRKVDKKSLTERTRNETDDEILKYKIILEEEEKVQIKFL